MVRPLVNVPRKHHSFILSAAFLLPLAACGPGVDPYSTTAQGIAIPGPWVIPPAVAAIADRQFVPYTGSPRIAPEGSCTSSNAFLCSCRHPACSRGLPGTLAFAQFIRRRFPGISGAGGFDCCRQNTGNTAFLSVHSIGRAIDLSIPRIGGDADNTVGDEVAHWLITHAQEIGVQLVIWDRSSWNASRAPGTKLQPYTGPIPHTDHIHMELSVDGANQRTPFFMSGAINGGATCMARCDGTRLVNADCSAGDCAAYGTTCVADPTPRCVSPACPPMGNAFICLDGSRRAECVNGLIRSIGDCGAFGSYCSTAGVTPTTARCVLSLCVSGPQAIPEAHRQCSITPGRQLDCRADGTAMELPCAAGQVCSMIGGTAHCEAPHAECPVPAMPPPNDDRTVCIGNNVARCFNGNVYTASECTANAQCSNVGGTAHCAQRACLDGAMVRAGDVCTPGGLIASCGEAGLFENVRICPMGQTCSTMGGAAHCVLGDPTGMDDEDLGGTQLTDDAATGDASTDGSAPNNSDGGVRNPDAQTAQPDGGNGPTQMPGCACTVGATRLDRTQPPAQRTVAVQGLLATLGVMVLRSRRRLRDKNQH